MQQALSSSLGQTPDTTAKLASCAHSGQLESPGLTPRQTADEGPGPPTATSSTAERENDGPRPGGAHGTAGAGVEGSDRERDSQDRGRDGARLAGLADPNGSRAVGGTIWCARRWDGTGTVLNASTSDDLVELLEGQASR